MSLKVVIFVAIVAVMSPFQCFAQDGQRTPTPCSTGQACLHNSGRSYINNEVYCCPNGAGIGSLSVIGHVVHCDCSSGVILSMGGNNVIINGNQVNASEVRPMLKNMEKDIQENMHQFKTELQGQMAQLKQTLSNLGKSLSNMFKF